MLEANVIGGREAWHEWARRELGAYSETQAAGVEAAVAMLAEGGSPRAATVAARVRAGAPVPPEHARELWEELRAVQRTIEELAVMQPSGELTKGAITELKRRYEARLSLLRPVYESALKSIPAAPGFAKPQAAVATGRPPRPSFREFLADNSILIISVAGGFLLIVATLLFEIYGSTTFTGAVRFFGVLAVNLVFGVAGYLSLGRSRLRLVGQIYLAIFALLTPLTIAAAWIFLDLESRGLPRELALAIGGFSCALLYGIIALRLTSRAYAALSLAALAAGWVGLLAYLDAGVWMAPWLAALTIVYLAIAFPPAWMAAPAACFTRVARPFVYGASAAALAVSLGRAGDELNAQLNSGRSPSYQLAVTFAVLAAAYGLYVWRSRKAWMLWAVWSGASLAILSANWPLGFEARGYLLELAVLAWAFALSIRWMPGRALPIFLRIGAAIQAAATVFLGTSPGWLPLVVLLAAAGVGLWLAIETRRAPWLLLTAGIFAVDWYWLAKTVLPPPAHQTLDALLFVYSPLPVLYAATGLALWWMQGRRWAWPLYAAGGAIGLWVVVEAMTQNDLELAGRALAVYAVVAYVLAAIGRSWWGVLASVAAAAGSVALLLAAAAAESPWYPPALTALAVGFYTGRFAWRRTAMALAHRSGALGLAGLTAAGSFGVADFWSLHGAGALAALSALIGAAALTLVDGRLSRRPLLDYVAAVAASLGGFWIARYVGIDNLQADVALTGVVLIAVGLIAPHDGRRAATLIESRAAVVAGAAILMGTSAYQSVTDPSPAAYTLLLVLEAVLGLLVGIWARSRSLVVAAGAGLAVGALRALFLILETVQVWVVFAVVAAVLLVLGALLAALRDRLGSFRSSVSDSWHGWA